LRGGDGAEHKCGDENDHVAAIQIHLRELQRSGYRRELQQQQPLLARAEMIQVRRPQEFQRPGQVQQTGRADGFERIAGVTQQYGQRQREEAIGQALGQVKSDQQQDFVGATHWT
jgi:hypothetical protein